MRVWILKGLWKVYETTSRPQTKKIQDITSKKKKKIYIYIYIYIKNKKNKKDFIISAQN
jgi:hypothetical protein